MDQEGNPLADVLVNPAGYIFSGITDKDGKFEFEFRSSVRDQKVIIFESSKYFEVKTVIVEDLSKSLYVVLKKRDRENEVFRSCPKEEKKITLIGDFAKLAINKNEFKVKRKGFEHGIGWKIRLKKNKEKPYISGTKGTFVVGGKYPTSFQLLESKSYTLRYRSSFLDWKGQRKDGTFWRFLGAGSVATFFSYSTNSKEVAEKFDKVFEDACF